jgi:putrescine transport system permease protein
VLKISLAKCRLGLPPFTELLQQADSYLYNVAIYFGNYLALASDSFYFSVVWSSFLMAAASTVVCLVIGYSMAYGISRTPKRYHIILILLIVLPFATSFLVRVYAWMSLLNTHGIINTLLLKIGLINEPLRLLDNNYAVCLGMVYCYLPFMILPIYATLDKIDQSYIEASSDLGASKWQSFWSITLPISMPGVLAGASLVFVPTLGEFVIPELLGGSKTMTIGQTIWCEFFNNRDWPLACAIAVLMMFSFVFYIILSKILPSFTKTEN